MKLLSDGMFAKKLGEAKLRILREQPFFAILLLHMRYYLDEDIGTAGTDGDSIVFAPTFLSRLDECELDFVLLHEIMHVALGHCFRNKGREEERFNIACDILVNDTIIEEIGLVPTGGKVAGVSLWSKTPSGESGTLYNAEEIYNMLPEKKIKSRRRFRDNHGEWPRGKRAAQTNQNPIAKWHDILMQAALAAERQTGTLPLMAQRFLKGWRKPRIDWRRLLYRFITPELFDYSFCGPDRRYQNSSIIMPGWTQTRDRINIWMAIDTSGSIDDEQLGHIFSEIKGAAATFNHKVKVSFFDATITAPQELSATDITNMQPVGGGGTDFFQIFAWLAENRRKINPDCIVIITDGYAKFPPESSALGIPVLWLLNNSKITPPWGNVARF